MAKTNKQMAFNPEAQAEVFAALGDSTRLRLVNKLYDGKAQSISSLTFGTKISRQAVTRHLLVLEDVGLVSKVKVGRETLFELDISPFKGLQKHLEIIASQWEQSLQNLKKFIEGNENR